VQMSLQKFKISKNLLTVKGVSGVTQLDQPLSEPGKFTFTGNREGSRQGILIAGTIFVLWAASLVLLLSLDVTKLQPMGIVLAMLWQMFLYTGLFITAHDAMHGQVCPQDPKINSFIGSLALMLYGLFSYKHLLKKHWDHHHYPASERDPDFHDGNHKNFFAWYFCFMKRYWSWTRLLGLIAIFKAIHYIFQVPENNLTLFWMLPAIFSSVQLFYFGTFLPHLEPKEGYDEPHRAQSSAYPAFWSFITCYHFGYHQEHHEYPQVPWWQLPAVYKMRVITASE